ncbi:hypothetical protein NK6_880 [Bradyrhizobium diazoefficiens]|uniref:Uncharacterized protein n=1 Tax=Bradyrhizobium diazoefficiens TaxID=1355477 RepID=A0A0E3VSK4_9BRAD|nr:hypothetical protein NK6_880 [Bradyrhizobium diazoefficiens]
MKIGPADAAGADSHPDLTFAGDWIGGLLHPQPCSRGSQHHRTHQSLRGEPLRSNYP